MRSDDIQPLSEYRANLTAHFKHVRETGRPMFVTSNGRTTAVVLSPEAYDALAEKAELAENLLLIDRGLEDVGAGRVRDARDGLRELAAKHESAIGRLDLRKLPFGDYLIFYHVDADRHVIHLLALRHGRRLTLGDE